MLILAGGNPYFAPFAKRGSSSRFIYMPLDWSQCPDVERDPRKVSGAWLFRGTRVPVATLFENLEAGATVDDFLEWFPGVTRRQADSVLEFATRSLAQA